MSRYPEQILNASMVIAEKLYGTAQHPDQMAVTAESVQKLDALTDSWFFYELDDNGRPVSWIVVVPTQKELMEKFVNREITEQQLLDLTKQSKHYDALYLCSAITIPEYRRQGLAYKLLTQAVTHFLQKNRFIQFFAWPTTAEGSALVYRLQKDLNITIHCRKA